MVLSTHAISGAATALIFRRYPVLALIAAFLSHFALDSIPHWHYKIISKSADASSPFGKKLSFGKNFLKDIFRTGLDFGIGLAISLIVSQIFFPGNLWMVFWGALAGALPDAFQVLYYRFKNFKPLYWLQWFHEKMHAERRLDNEPVKGIFYQIAISAIIVTLIIALR